MKGQMAKGANAKNDSHWALFNHFKSHWHIASHHMQKWLADCGMAFLFLDCKEFDCTTCFFTSTPFQDFTQVHFQIQHSQCISIAWHTVFHTGVKLMALMVNGNNHTCEQSDVTPSWGHSLRVFLGKGLTRQGLGQCAMLHEDAQVSNQRWIVCNLSLFWNPDEDYHHWSGFVSESNLWTKHSLSFICFKKCQNQSSATSSGADDASCHWGGSEITQESRKTQGTLGNATVWGQWHKLTLASSADFHDFALSRRTNVAFPTSHNTVPLSGVVPWSDSCHPFALVSGNWMPWLQSLQNPAQRSAEGKHCSLYSYYGCTRR